MKLLFVLENYHPHIGGVETLFKSLCESLASRGEEVTVFTTGVIKTAAKKETLNGVHIIRTGYSNRYLFTFISVVALIPLARKCDHIHTTSYNAAIPAKLAAWWCKKPISITFHEVWATLWFKLPYMTKLGAWLHYTFEQFILKLRFDRFVAVSNSTRQGLIEHGVSVNRISMIYNGLDYKDFETKEAGTGSGFTYCYFGRLGVSKGLDLLLEAVPLIHEQIPESHFKLIIPKIPRSFYKRIQKAIKTLGIRDDTIELNHLPFTLLKREISSADVVVIPSYSEGFCFTAVESMALGTPLVISGKGALAEVVTGHYIVMEAMTSKALADAVYKAYMGHWTYKPTKKYPLTKTIQAYEALFDKLSPS